MVPIFDINIILSILFLLKLESNISDRKRGKCIAWSISKSPRNWIPRINWYLFRFVNVGFEKCGPSMIKTLGTFSKT